jgi:hypothetical protein
MIHFNIFFSTLGVRFDVEWGASAVFFAFGWRHGASLLGGGKNLVKNSGLSLDFLPISLQPMDQGLEL